MMRNLKNILLGASLLLLGSCSGQPEATSSTADIVLENIMTRASVRSFTSAPVSRETLQKIVRAGIQAPSAMNKQDWEVRVVDNQDKINALSAMLKAANPNAQDRFPGKNSFGNAAALIFIASEVADTAPGSFADVDAGLLAGNIIHAAKALGLGACVQAGPVAQMGNIEEARDFIKSLNFSEGYKVSMVIPVGYPDENPSPRERDTTKIQFID